MQRLLLGLSVLVVGACSLRASDAPSSKSAPPVAVAAAVLEAPAPVHFVPAFAGTKSTSLDSVQRRWTPVTQVQLEQAPAPSVEMEKEWRGFGVPNCSYLAPKADFIADDGGVDVVFHFHAGQMSEREMRESGVRGVFVSCGYGMGTGGYSRAFADPSRFGSMMKRLLKTVGASAKRNDPHLRHLALVSWSAGFAAVSRILSVTEWYEATDTVVLLDSIHAQYVQSERSKGPQRGAENVDVRMLERFTRFASDAAAGKKTMVITHSAILPPDYASTAESTAALLGDIGVHPVRTDERNARGMVMSVKADEGGLHVRGFRGVGPRDHFDHLHLIGDSLRSWLVPRWYTPGSERP
jgi:hypothetical protein